MKAKTENPAPKVTANKKKKTSRAVAPPTTLEGAFEKYRREAEALDASLVEPMRADLPLVLHTSEQCVAAIAPSEAVITIELPNIDYDSITQLPDIVRATMYAAQQVTTTDKTSDVQDNIAKARTLRKAMLAAADSLVLAGVLPKKEVQAIRKGAGFIKMADDCVALASLFRKTPKAQSQSPITSQQIEDASTLGTQLLSQLNPKGGKKGANLDRTSAIDLRDRLWTLAVLRYRDLWRAGAYLFGHEGIDAQVPPLLTRVGSKKKTAPAPTPSAAGKAMIPSNHAG